jgi:isopentenyl diphosphate isomerase/L-lactate dehydrogenase-like FMN-dependent dehydrogenase
MINVDEVDTTTKMLGQEVSLPVSRPCLLRLYSPLTVQIFLCPTGMAALSDPQGERLLAKAAGECNAMYMVSLCFQWPLFVSLVTLLGLFLRLLSSRRSS